MAVPTREDLIQLYVVEKLSCRSIGERFDLKSETVRRHLIAHDIPRRTPKEAGAVADRSKQQPAGPLPKDLLERMYLRQERGHQRSPGRTLPADLTTAKYGCPVCPREERS